MGLLRRRATALAVGLTFVAAASEGGRQRGDQAEAGWFWGGDAIGVSERLSPASSSMSAMKNLGGVEDDWVTSDDMVAVGNEYMTESDLQNLLENVEGEAAGVQPRRRLGTSSSGDTYAVQVQAYTGNSSSHWYGAAIALEVGATIPGQDATPKQSLFRYTVGEGETTPKVFQEVLERGCYTIYTYGGDRPYDVLWSVSVDGEAIQGASGGGEDWHSFGIGGALCSLSSCYTSCYYDLETSNYEDQLECQNYGDLLAPTTEVFGANCTCEDSEELELRLDCLNNVPECQAGAQCYSLNEAASEVSTANVVRLVIYVTITGSSFDVASAEAAVASWLNVDTQYVDLEFVGGKTPADDSVTVRARRALSEEGVFSEGDTRHRRLQSTGTFKRLEYKIVTSDEGDVVDLTTTAGQGAGGLNVVLAAQGADTGLDGAEAYTVEVDVTYGEYVAATEVPSGSIAGTASETAADLAGDGNEDEDEDDDAHFTQSPQFIIGAGLVVVVAVALSFVACVVFHMKRKARREFERKNEAGNGERQPVEVFDPWASVARSFKTLPYSGAASSRPSSNSGRTMMNGNRVAVFGGTESP